MRKLNNISGRIAYIFLFLLVSGTVVAENLISPNGNLRLNFFVNAQGEPVYELFYKERPVVKPSKLGLELQNSPSLKNLPILRNVMRSSISSKASRS